MYWNVPTIEPFWVSGDAAEVNDARFIVGVVGVNVPKACEAFGTFGFASPKSISLAPACVSMMFAGFRSRWIMPR
jgi:hypothetical protein